MSCPSVRGDIPRALSPFLVDKHCVAISYTISLAIVLYGRAHPHHIASFICCHEDTSADHLTGIFIKNTELPNAAALLK